jgi:hypothetical protein
LVRFHGYAQQPCFNSVINVNVGTAAITYKYNEMENIKTDISNEHAAKGVKAKSFIRELSCDLCAMLF